MRRGQPLDDRQAAERRVAALGPEVDVVAARGKFLDDRLDVPVVAVVQRGEQDLHGMCVPLRGPRRPARCVNMSTS
jgi:hypothetical protein